MIDVRTVDTVTVASVSLKHITNDEEVHGISREIKDLLSSIENKKILLNLERVETMASLMVGELIMLQKIFKNNSADLRICSLSPTVGEALKISGISDLLDIYEDEQAGLANFGD